MLPLLVFLRLVGLVTWQKFAWHCKSLSKDQVCRGCTNVRLEGCADGQEAAWQGPEPIFWFVKGKCVEGLFEAPVETFHESV